MCKMCYRKKRKANQQTNVKYSCSYYFQLDKTGEYFRILMPFDDEPVKGSKLYMSLFYN